MSVITRFPPSPTGYVHIWSLRTVLYNYLYAKKNNGKMLLRIEDTDRTRLVEGSVENMLQVLAAVWLIPDEGPNNPWDKWPYFQSQRLDIYQKYSQTLLDSEHSYYCFCTSERLDELRKEQESLKLPTRYDGKCRFLTPEEIQENLKKWISFTTRLKVPQNQTVIFDDVIRGKVEISTKDIDDQVLMKSDGFPTYHLANVIDDHLMGVTHVIRWEEWVPSTPKHILLYEAFWWEKPVFAHLPLLLWKDKKKLSKRSGDVSVESYLEKWYPTQAILNYIALLGWNPKTTQEFFSMQELIDMFDLEQVHKAGAVFDIERLEWFSSKYINNFSNEELLDKLTNYASNYDKKLHTVLEKWTKESKEYVIKIIWESKWRMKKYSDFWGLTSFFFTEPNVTIEYAVNEKMWVTNNEDIRASLNIWKYLLQNKKWAYNSLDEIKNEFIAEISKNWKKNGQILWPLRVALTWEISSPGAFEMIYILWKEKSIERIDNFLKEL